MRLKSLFAVGKGEQVIECKLICTFLLSHTMYNLSHVLDFTCTLRGKSGHLFITSTHIYFFARKRNEETRETFSFSTVSLHKQNTALVVPTGIEINSGSQKVCQLFITHQKHLFYGFQNRDHVYKVLTQMKSSEATQKKTVV